MKDCCKSCPTHPCKAERTASQKQMSKGISTFNPDDYNAGQEEDAGYVAGMIIGLTLVIACAALAIGFVSCAHAGVEDEAKTVVDASHKYLMYYGEKRPADAKPYELNCMGYARKYVDELGKRGVKGVIQPCTYTKTAYKFAGTTNKEPRYQSYTTRTPHVYVQTQTGWILDNRYAAPVRMADYDCE